MTREHIEDFREIVLPFVKKRLLETNYENLGESDAEMFAKDFDEILNLAIKALDQEPTYCPKFRNHLEKHRVFHAVTAIEKCLNVIGNDDTIDDISILKELVQKIEVEE